MAEMCIMIEGQSGLTWARWQKICTAADALGWDGLFRSDHLKNPVPDFEEALELWTSLTYAAGQTHRVVFGPLVTPITFRHPVWIAKMAAAVDDLSHGRLVLGLGAGWNRVEHRAFGLPFPPDAERFARLEEALQVIRALFHADQPTNLAGKYYTLEEALLLPRPERRGGPPVLIGGNGPKYTLPLAAKYADEWNAVYVNAAAYKMLRRKFNGFLAAAGRSPAQLKYSLMTGLYFAKNQMALKRTLDRARQNYAEARTLTDDELITYVRQKGPLIGTPNQIVDQIGELVEAGVSRLMLQWLDLDDLSGLELLAQQVLGHTRKMTPPKGG
jgi:F420-dependent oxidoreductase-like protein